MGACNAKAANPSFLYSTDSADLYHAQHCEIHRTGKKARVLNAAGQVLYEGYVRAVNRSVIPHGRRGTLYCYDQRMPDKSYKLQCRWSDGRPVGICLEFYILDDRQKAIYTTSTTTARRIGRHVEYYMTGNIQFDVYYDHDGRKIGQYTYYYPNGKKQIEGILDAAGRLHGQQFHYNLVGQLIESAAFHHGQRQEQTQPPTNP